MQFCKHVWIYEKVLKKFHSGAVVFLLSKVDIVHVSIERIVAVVPTTLGRANNSYSFKSTHL